MSKNSREPTLADLTAPKNLLAANEPPPTTIEELPPIHADYHAPHALRQTATPLRRALVIGSCNLGQIVNNIALGLEPGPCDFFNIHHGCFLPEAPPRPIGEYDFSILQLPIRTLVNERALMRLPFDDETGYQRLFDETVGGLIFSLKNALLWCDQFGIPTFVCNFSLPQQNPFGRFQPRYSLNNPVAFIDGLNRSLYEEVVLHHNAYLLDADQISAMHGRRHTQDDAVMVFSHGAPITSWDDHFDRNRLQPPHPTMVERYASKMDVYLNAIWSEAVAMYRTLKQIDPVKLIVIDLDDTLWRGVAAEGAAVEPHFIEGWPLGFAEALLYLKKRGALLAVISKNDDARVRALWPEYYGDRLQISDFAAWKVNWDLKPVNMADILSSVNVLPKSVVFIDDNPVERHRMMEAYPEIRVIGADPHSFRRTLLWSSETQVPTITTESLNRTEMVQAQINREDSRKLLSETEFLASLSPRVGVFEVKGGEEYRAGRIIELLNKTNQFTTTPKRWTVIEISDFLNEGGKLFGFQVEDNYTKYGIVGAVVARPGRIIQFAMSCRVLGLQAEIGALSVLLPKIEQDGRVIGEMTETDANGPARDLWIKVGFRKDEGHFVLDGGPMPLIPAHIKSVELLI